MRGSHDQVVDGPIGLERHFETAVETEPKIGVRPQPTRAGFSEGGQHLIPFRVQGDSSGTGPGIFLVILHSLAVKEDAANLVALEEEVDSAGGVKEVSRFHLFLSANAAAGRSFFFSQGPFDRGAAVTDTNSGRPDTRLDVSVPGAGKKGQEGRQRCNACGETD